MKRARGDRGRRTGAVPVLLLGSSLRVGAQAQDPHYPVAGSRVRMAIHEVLHCLGLREGPPSSEEITARVLDRCQ